MKEDNSILYEDGELIVCIKPPGIPSQSDKSSDYDMVNQLKNYLFAQRPEAGAPYVAVIHRLDRPVGGIMVFAKTAECAKALSAAIQRHEVKKQYLAVITKVMPEDTIGKRVRLEDYLRKDGKTNCSTIVDQYNKEAKQAVLYYTVLETKPEEGITLLKIELETGRHHQIRVQMAEHLAGIWGDTKYNAKNCQLGQWQQIALFAYQLEFIHPKIKRKMNFFTYPKETPFLSFAQVTEA